MICLALDTAGAEGGVAVAEFVADGTLPSSRVFSRTLPPREVSRQLMPAIADLLAEMRCTAAVIDCFAAVSGPGSFTGIRVGLAAVKGMADARTRPVLGVSRLALMAAVGRAATSSGASRAYSVLDAGRGEFYLGEFPDGEFLAKTESIESRASLQQRIQAAPDPVFACEPAVLEALAASLPQMPPIAIPAPRVSDLLLFAGLAWRGERGLQFGSPAALTANYVRQAYPAKPAAAPVPR
jgi:tRNA threonylcarbamoyladenosine biosynthesis protein TsaB